MNEYFVLVKIITGIYINQLQNSDSLYLLYYRAIGTWTG